jgi:hypothetical protein
MFVIYGQGVVTVENTYSKNVFPAYVSSRSQRNVEPLRLVSKSLRFSTEIERDPPEKTREDKLVLKPSRSVDRPGSAPLRKGFNAKKTIT